MSNFGEMNLAEFWEDSDYARREYILPSPTNDMIKRVQDRLGYRLPDAYIELMRIQNGGIPTKTAFPTDSPTSWADDHIAVSGIKGIGDTKLYSLCGQLGSQSKITEWGYPPIGIYFGDCPSAGHDMICLDYRACGPLGEPKVVHVDQDNDYKITHLADNFELFICGLAEEGQFDDVEYENSTDFIWRTDVMVASIQRDDEFLKIGQYLDLKQTLAPQDAGWVNMKLDIPENWDVQNVSLSERVVILETKGAGKYSLTGENIGGLSSELLECGGDKSDVLLEAIWKKHAIIVS